MELSSSINGEFHEDQYKDWLIDIKGEMEPDPDQCCIYRVPTRIRNVNKEAYTPQVVSIGPFHYGKKELEFMEKQKGKYVRKFFKRTTREKREEVFAFIKDHEQQIRNCYSDTCKLNSHEYVMMILRDALFIIELLLRDYDDDDASDFFLNIPAEVDSLLLDLQMLENQLPYFLLEGLYKLVVSSPSFILLCCHFFRGPDQMFDSVPHQVEIKHFTDLLRAALVKSYPEHRLPKFDEAYRDVDLPSAAKLRESGVKFKSADQVESLFDIRFDGHS